MEIIKRVKNIILLMKNIDIAVSRFRNADEQYKEMSELSARIREEKLDDIEIAHYGYRDGEPFLIGSIIEMARFYNLDFHLGTCYGDCQAVLERKHWKKPINKNICSFNYGTWIYKNPDEVEYINAYSNTMPVAILECLLNARVAGVI